MRRKCGKIFRASSLECIVKQRKMKTDNLIYTLLVGIFISTAFFDSNLVMCTESLKNIQTSKAIVLVRIS